MKPIGSDMVQRDIWEKNPTRNDTIEFVFKKGPVTYAQILRVIGQTLEKFRAEDFWLMLDDDKYFLLIKSTVPLLVSKIKHQLKTQLSAAWQTFQRRYKTKRLSAPFALHYTLQDISKLEVEGQARRKHEGMPDAYSLSQLLRTIGAYIDSKDGRLLDLSKKGHWVSIRYDTAQGSIHEERLKLSSLYNIFVHMYLKRSSRKLGLKKSA
ncbi:MAG: hypothetical protein ACREQA_17070 [Candidatus Binatia bacterium]